MALIERVFRQEELNQDKRVGRSDLDAMEKEISIDIAELRRDLRTMPEELCSQITTILENNTQQQHSTEIGSNKIARENNFSVNRQSRKNNILNEASYLAHRLSRALSNTSTTEDEQQGEKDDTAQHIDRNNTEEKPLDLKNGKNVL